VSDREGREDAQALSLGSIQSWCQSIRSSHKAIICPLDDLTVRQDIMRRPQSNIPPPSAPAHVPQVSADASSQSFTARSSSADSSSYHSSTIQSCCPHAPAEVPHSMSFQLQAQRYHYQISLSFSPTLSSVAGQS